MSRFGAGGATALFLGVFLAFSTVAVDHAEARRGGSFGSRGTRTFQAPPATRTAPERVAPVERSTTPNTVTPNTGARQQPGATAQGRGGLFGSGFGGALTRGLLIGGLFGLLLGHGFGGLAGMAGLLFQILLIAGVVWLALRLLRSRPATANRPAYAGAGGPGGGALGGAGGPRQGSARQSFTIPGLGSGAGAAAQAGSIRLAQSDLDTFERRLTEVQEAYGREDFAALRRYATPEMVSYLGEELAENAKRGVVNEVSDVRLVQADIAESWREGTDDYATAALRYASRDVTRERASGRVVAGQADGVTETTELWTFRRQNNGDWKLSAIQEA